MLLALVRKSRIGQARRSAGRGLSVRRARAVGPRCHRTGPPAVDDRPDAAPVVVREWAPGLDHASQIGGKCAGFCSCDFPAPDIPGRKPIGSIPASNHSEAVCGVAISDRPRHVLCRQLRKEESADVCPPHEKERPQEERDTEDPDRRSELVGEPAGQSEENSLVA